MLTKNKQRHCALILIGFLLALTPPISASGTLPDWTVWQGAEMQERVIPTQLKSPELPSIQFLILRLDADWSPEWKEAAFQLKSLIVSHKTSNPELRVGITGQEQQINSLLAHEMAPYLDGYLFSDTPFLPSADETGKLWQKLEVAPKEVLSSLLDASSIGIEVVFFENLVLSESHRALLDIVDQTETGSLDLQPSVSGISQDEVRFFFEPDTGNYHLAVYAELGSAQTIHFSLAKETVVTALYPRGVVFGQSQQDKTTELRLSGNEQVYFFQLELGEKSAASESIQIISKKTIDPYELVVKNQVFKESQQRDFQSLEVDEELNYRYQATNGIDIDVTFLDTVIERRGKPIERIRRETYLTGVKWPSKKQPELPLISPEKVQTAPLVIDLDKSYQYLYKGDDMVAGNPTWKVHFEPKGEGKFYSGTVWIDKQSGAHRKLKAVQSGLTPPVVGNEMTVYFDWVEEKGKRHWAQIREENLQLVNIVGERIVVQISGRRSNFRYNNRETEVRLENAYAGSDTILRDTEAGFRYLKKDKDGERELSQNTYLSKKAGLIGVQFDPALDFPLPLAGFNYTNLNFLDRDLQANFFVAGAVNDFIVSDANYLDRGWDLTAELFLTPIHFGSTLYEANEKRDDLEVKSLRENFKITLGMPVASFLKLSVNYSLRYFGYKGGDDTDPNYVIPQSHLEHLGQLELEYSRARFVSKIRYAHITRSQWEPYGLPEDIDTFSDSYSRIRFDAGLSKQLPNFQNVSAEARYLKGWDLDRFSRFGFGFFGNRVDGFGTSGISGDEAVRLKLEYEIGIKGLFNVEIRLSGAQAKLNQEVLIGGYRQPDKVDLAGVGIATNFLGPWRTLVRVDMGYGLHSTLKAEAGDFSGQVAILKLY